MVKKKKPERTCMACNEQKEKQELLRIVKSKDGIIEVDLTGKKCGRGAYICKNETCLDKLIKSKRLERVFEKEISPELYESIRGVISGK
ncbi:MAG: YlxR family protein [Clostridia bacterium]|nr:YlxR family protein [Clostridia bacterium]